MAYAGYTISGASDNWPFPFSPSSYDATSAAFCVISPRFSTRKPRLVVTVTIELFAKWMRVRVGPWHWSWSCWAGKERNDSSSVCNAQYAIYVWDLKFPTLEWFTVTRARDRIESFPYAVLSFLFLLNVSFAVRARLIELSSNVLIAIFVLFSSIVYLFYWPLKQYRVEWLMSSFSSLIICR